MVSPYRGIQLMQLHIYVLRSWNQTFSSNTNVKTILNHSPSKREAPLPSIIPGSQLKRRLLNVTARVVKKANTMA